MDRKKHALITADLAKLDAKRKSAGESHESRALQRANYFVQQKSRTDVIQEVYSVKNPSAGLQKVAQELEQTICPSPKIGDRQDIQN